MPTNTKPTKPEKLIFYTIVTAISIFSIFSLIFLGSRNRLWVWAANQKDSQQTIQSKSLVMVNNSGVMESQVDGEFLLKKHSQDGLSGNLSFIINGSQKQVSKNYASFEEYKISLKKGDKLVIKINPKFDIFVKEIFSTDQNRTKIEVFDQSFRIAFEDSEDADFNDLVLDLVFPEIQTTSSASLQQSSYSASSDQSSSSNSSSSSISSSSSQSSSVSSSGRTSSSKSSSISYSKSQPAESSSSSNQKIEEKKKEENPKSIENQPTCPDSIQGDRIYGGGGVDKMIGSRGCFFGQEGDDNYTVRPYTARTGDKEVYIFDDQGFSPIEISADYKLIKQEGDKLFLENSGYKTTVYINGKNIQVKYNNKLLIIL
jgi:hypothetical protein